MPFINPPFAAVLLAPLSQMSMTSAELVWTLLSLAIAIPAALSLTKSVSSTSRLVSAGLAATVFPMYQTLAEGQWSIILLAGCLAALYFGRNKHGLAAGACLSVLWLKPQLALIAIAGLLVCKAWRPGAVMLAMLGAFFVLSLPFTGLGADRSYVLYIVEVMRSHAAGAGAAASTVWQGNLRQTEGINGLLAGWLGQSHAASVDGLLMLAVVPTLILYFMALLKVRPGFQSLEQRLMLVASLGIGLLVDPHLYQQDLTLLLLVVPILVEYSRHRFGFLLAVCLAADVSMIDILWPLHLFTMTVWAATLGICVATLWRKAAPALIQRFGFSTLDSDAGLITA